MLTRKAQVAGLVGLAFFSVANNHQGIFQIGVLNAGKRITPEIEQTRYVSFIEGPLARMSLSESWQSSLRQHRNLNENKSADKS